MASKNAWLAECHLQFIENDRALDFACYVSVWTSGPEDLHRSVNASLTRTGYRLVDVMHCSEAPLFVATYDASGEGADLMGAVSETQPVVFGKVRPKEATYQTESLRTALLGLDYKSVPVFAVLDGAQFQDLPATLFDGDFISRPLYVDRGENDPQQVVTAPHLVTLDERQETVIGRSYRDTVSALLDVIGEKPAAVFWQCSQGVDVLYRHLRGINMVLYPKDELRDWEEREPPEGEEPSEPDTHTLVLFRHADANVMAQVIPSMTDLELSRLFGPANRLLFDPSAEWSGAPGCERIDVPQDLPVAPKGSLRLSHQTLAQIDQISDYASQKKIEAYLHEVAPEYTAKLSQQELTDTVTQAGQIGRQIGLTTEYSHGLWAFLALFTGKETLTNPQVLSHFDGRSNEADDLVDDLYQQLKSAEFD